MKVAAIITEYNPFHNGHKYQIDKIRELLGDDCAIIAIMSGNYTQRGEIAIADKTERAKAAVNNKLKSFSQQRKPLTKWKNNLQNERKYRQMMHNKGLISKIHKKLI